MSAITRNSKQFSEAVKAGNLKSARRALVRLVGACNRMTKKEFPSNKGKMPQTVLSSLSSARKFSDAKLREGQAAILAAIA